MSLFFLVFQVKLFIKLFYAAFPKCLERAEVESLLSGQLVGANHEQGKIWETSVNGAPDSVL